MTKMLIDRAVLKQALEDLEAVYGDSCDAIHGLRATLAQPEPAAPTEPAPGWCKHCRQYTIAEPLQAAPTVEEPVAWRCANASPPGGYVVFQQYPQALKDLGIPIEPLYTSPPRAPTDCGEAGHAEGRCGNASCLKAAAPTVVEPVAWMVYTLDGKSVCVTDNPADFTDENRVLPLYTAPPPPRAPLSDEQIDDCLPLGMAPHSTLVGPDEIRKFARAVEAAHGIGGPK